MGKSIQSYSALGQKSRNKLLTELKCGRRILQNCEDLAIELIPDFREGLDWQRLTVTRLPNGAVEARRDRQGLLNPYQTWVLRQLVALWRKHKGDSDRIYDLTLRKAEKLSRSNFDD